MNGTRRETETKSQGNWNWKTKENRNEDDYPYLLNKINGAVTVHFVTCGYDVHVMHNDFHFFIL